MQVSWNYVPEYHINIVIGMIKIKSIYKKFQNWFKKLIIDQNQKIDFFALVIF